MPRITRLLVGLSSAVCCSSILGAVSAHPAPAVDMRWSLDTVHVLGTSGPVSGATMKEVRIFKIASVDEPYGGNVEYGFRGMRIGEASDRPCSFNFTTESLERNGKALSDFGTPCEKGSANDSKSAVLPEGSFVRGVQVCTNDDNTRVKGLKLSGIKFDAAGKPVTVESASFERTNCKNWHPPASCATGEIVTAIRTYVKSDALTGLGIECRPVHTQANAPRDYKIEITPAAALDEYSPGRFKMTYKVKLTSNHNKVLKFRSINVRPPVLPQFEGFMCGAGESKPFDLEPGKSYETTVTTGCNFPDLMATIAGCSVGSTCTVPMEHHIDVMYEPGRSWNQTGSGKLDVKLKRPLVVAVAAKPATIVR